MNDRTGAQPPGRVRNGLRTVLALLGAAVGILLALPAVLAAAPFLVVASSTRFFASLLQPSAVPWEDLIEFDDRVGWKPRPDLRAVALDLNGDPFRVTTDSEGWRGSGSIEKADTVVFGDSYAFGSGIDDEHFFGDLPGGPLIKCVGAPGYNLVQSYLWMVQYADRLCGKTVVWLVYPANDLHDNLLPHMDGYRMPFLRRDGEDWEIVRSHLTPDSWPFHSHRRNNERFLDICSSVAGTGRVFDAFEHLLREAEQVCASVGSELVVATVPDLSPVNCNARQRLLDGPGGWDQFDETLPDRLMAAICERAGVRFLPLSDFLEPADYLRLDVHWTPSGHRKVARAIRTLAGASGSDSNVGLEARTVRPSEERAG